MLLGSNASWERKKRMKRLLNRALVTVVVVFASVLIGWSTGASAEASTDQAPPGLAGIWHHVFPDGFDQRLVLAGTRFAFFGDSANGQAVGDIVVNGDTITFSNSNQCPGSATYQWSVTDGVLRFVQLTPAPCPRAGRLPDVDWTRL
jgi:hypothetical protein